MGFNVDLDKLADRLRRKWAEQRGLAVVVPFDKLTRAEQAGWLELAASARAEVATQVATYEMRDDARGRPSPEVEA